MSLREHEAGREPKSGLPLGELENQVRWDERLCAERGAKRRLERVAAYEPRQGRAGRAAVRAPGAFLYDVLGLAAG